MITLLLRETRPGYDAGLTLVKRRNNRQEGLHEALRESDLWSLWEGQRFPKGALVTEAGEPLRVIYRGRPGAGPGPDFRDAIIAGPDGLLEGDVELHVRTSDFRRHGHHLDPAYGRIALHLVFVHDEPGGKTPLPGGASALVAALGSPRAGRWLERPARWGEPCRNAVPRLGAQAVGETLDRLGSMRFRQKTAAVRKRLRAGDAAEAVLWQGLLEGLGYGGAREELAAVARAVPWDALHSLLAPLPRKERVAVAENALCSAYQAPPVRRGRMAPERRLGGAAALAARFAGPGLAASLLGPLAEDPPDAGGIVRLLTVPWLVGRARALELAANAVLPLAAALCDEPAARRIEDAYARLPRPARYGNVRHLHAVTGEDVRVDFRRQQGMLYLLRQYCTQGGCGKCPLS